MKEIVEIYLNNNASGLRSSILVSNPLQKKHEIPFSTINKIIYDACKKANDKKIKGKDLTPFLLKEIVKLTKGKSLRANVNLALNNIKLGIKVLNEMMTL